MPGKRDEKKPRKVKVEAEKPKALGKAPEDADPEATESCEAVTEGAAEAQPQQAAEAVSSLEEQLAQARAAAQEAHNNYLYAVAELQNARRRFSKELADRQQFANEQLVSNLLPILDDFERAVQASQQTGAQAGQGGNAESLRLGVAMILKHCHETLGRFGLSRMEVAEGDAFDPHRHEVVETVVDDSVEEGTILEVLRPGYELHGRVLRAAQVKAAARQASEDRA